MPLGLRLDDAYSFLIDEEEVVGEAVLGLELELPNGDSTTR